MALPYYGDNDVSVRNIDRQNGINANGDLRFRSSLVSHCKEIVEGIGSVSRTLKLDSFSDETIAHIVEFAVEIDSCTKIIDRCRCTSANSEGNEKTNTRRWSFTWNKGPISERNSCVVFCNCGKLTCYSTKRPLRIVDNIYISPFIFSEPARWQLNRHFDIESDGTRLVRHRGSDWHNFRSGASREWVKSGKVRYKGKLVSGRLDEALEDQMETVIIPGARLAFGIIGRNAELNTINDYVLGQHLGTIGLALALAENHENKISCISLLCGPDGRTSKSFPLRNNQVIGGGYKRFIDIEVDICIDIEKRDVAFAVNGQKIPINVRNCLPSGPLAFAVSLKYAHDTVEIQRVE